MKNLNQNTQIFISKPKSKSIHQFSKYLFNYQNLKILKANTYLCSPKKTETLSSFGFWHIRVNTLLICFDLNMACNGAPGEIRTPDPLVRSQVLYPTELRALMWLALYNIFMPCQAFFLHGCFVLAYLQKSFQIR